MAASKDSLAAKLVAAGMQISHLSMGPFRARLEPFYAKCLGVYREGARRLFEAAVGRLG